MGNTSTPLVAAKDEARRKWAGVGLRRWDLRARWGGEKGARTEITLLEFSGDVTLDEGGLSGSTISDQKHFELCSLQKKTLQLEMEAGRMCAGERTG